MPLRPLEVAQTFVAKTYDVDYASIVHNLVYIRWLEDLRLQLLVETMPMEEMVAEGITPILTRTDIEYRHPVRLGQAVQGHMWISQLRRTQWVVQAEMVLDGTIATRATQSGYFAGLEQLRPVRVPQKLRRLYEKALEGAT